MTLKKETRKKHKKNIKKRKERPKVERPETFTHWIFDMFLQFVGFLDNLETSHTFRTAIGHVFR